MRFFARDRKQADLYDLLARDRRAQGRLKLAQEGRLPMLGGAQQFITNVANSTALVAAQATIIGPIVGIPQDPLIVAFFYASNVTANATTVAVTGNLVRSDTSVVFSAAVLTNPGAGTSAMGPLFCIGIVPFGIPAANGVLFQAAAPSGSPIIQGSATAPQILGILGFS